jgi:hypothetical protein
MSCARVATGVGESNDQSVFATKVAFASLMIRSDRSSQKHLEKTFQGWAQSLDQTMPDLIHHCDKNFEDQSLRFQS